MTFAEDLASGVHGLRFAPSPSLELLEQDELMAAYADRAGSTGWWFFFFPGLRLVLDPTALHLRDTQHHTRALFDSMFRQIPSTSAKPEKPRTSDPAWTPLIELEACQVGSTAAVHVLHRMTYQPGHETIMGHTLIPVAGGLFEARWVCPTVGPTGVRESVVVDELLAGKGPRQVAIDAPEHDAKFPDHPLSRARRAKAWHVGTVEITAAAPPPATTHTLAPGVAVALPPRFQHTRTVELDGAPTALFDRISFSGTDGLDRLVVSWETKPFRGHKLQRALTLAANRQCKVFLGEGVVDPEIRMLEEASTPDAVTMLAEGPHARGGGTPNRVVGRWFVRDNRLATVALVTTVAPPLPELLAVLETVVQSWS